MVCYFFCQVPAWAGGTGEGERFKEALTVVKESDQTVKDKKSKDFGTRSAPCMFFILTTQVHKGTVQWET